jgi:hypothetical protein
MTERSFGREEDSEEDAPDGTEGLSVDKVAGSSVRTTVKAENSIVAGGSPSCIMALSHITPFFSI